MVADGGDDDGDLLRRTVQIVQDAERHHSPGLGVVHPVDQISDVVEKAGDLGQFHRPLRIPQRGEDIGRILRHHRHMGKAVFRISKGAQGLIRPLDIRSDGRVISDVLICEHCISPFRSGRHCRVRIERDRRRVRRCSSSQLLEGWLPVMEYSTHSATLVAWSPIRSRYLATMIISSHSSPEAASAAIRLISSFFTWLNSSST